MEWNTDPGEATCKLCHRPALAKSETLTQAEVKIAVIHNEECFRPYVALNEMKLLKYFNIVMFLFFLLKKRTSS